MSRLGPGREFERIAAIAAALGPRAAEIGDDCAMLPITGGFIALSTDATVEGVHFERGWIDWDEIGARAAAGALSDLAAVGAEPIGLLAAVTVPPELDDAAVVEIMTGVGEVASVAGGQVLGGDLSAGPVISLTITVVGRVSAWIGRSGAQPGDDLWVTGSLGGARAAVLAWKSGMSPDPRARASFAAPVPRLTAGRWLAANGARAMIDLSDGLAGDARHLAAASACRLIIDLAKLPVHPAVKSAAGYSASANAAIGGEDYELLVAIDRHQRSHLENFGDREAGVRLTRIGEVAEGRGVELLEDGARLDLAGFDHFR